MVQEAEANAEEDKAIKERVDTRNSFESYVYNMRNLMGDAEQGVAGKISEANREVTSRAYVGSFAALQTRLCGATGLQVVATRRFDRPIAHETKVNESRISCFDCLGVCTPIIDEARLNGDQSSRRLGTIFPARLRVVCNGALFPFRRLSWVSPH